MMSLEPREAFVVAALRHLGETVVWNGLDCSELVALGEMSVLGVDRRGTHTANIYLQRNKEPTASPALGDLCFWGKDGFAIHVAIVAYGGHILSADGATSKVTEFADAQRNPNARVRLHRDIGWYTSAPFIGYRVHYELDP